MHRASARVPARADVAQQQAGSTHGQTHPAPRADQQQPSGQHPPPRCDGKPPRAAGEREEVGAGRDPGQPARSGDKGQRHGDDLLNQPGPTGQRIDLPGGLGPRADRVQLVEPLGELPQPGVLIDVGHRHLRVALAQGRNQLCG